MNFLGKNIRFLRKQLHQNQSDIAELIGKGQTTIGNWENGVSEPNLDELVILSNFFGVPVDILLKIDLSLTNPLPSENTHREGTDIHILKEPDDASLSSILDRLNNIQEQIDSINKKMEEK